MKTAIISLFRSVCLKQAAAKTLADERRCGLFGNSVSSVLVAAFCVALTICTAPSWADNRSWHSGETAQISYTDWMKWIPDDLPLSRISFPSSHDTASLLGGPIVKTQSMPLEEQLKAGIRALDIRAWHVADAFLIVHGVVFQFLSFDHILSACNTFLEENPSETILLWLGVDGVSAPLGNTRTFYETFLATRNSALGARISTTIVGNRHDAPLGEARGKIVIIETFPCESCDSTWGSVSFPDCGLNGDSIDNRDAGSTVYATATSMNGFWNDIRGHFELIDASGDESRMFQNSLAGSGGLFPIDAANGVFGFEGMNSRALKYLFEGNQNYTGLLWMDFPGPSLISAVIAQNMKFATNISALAGDFEKVVEQVSYAMTEDGDDASAARARQLKDYLEHILPQQYWSVLVSGTLGSDNWGYSVVTDGLFHKTDWIDGYSHVAINARQLNADITSLDILTYLTPQLLATLSGDAVARASGVRELLRTRFPWARWNVAVKRLPFEEEHWGTALDAAASASVLMVDEGEVYLCTAWATVGFNRAPVANAGSEYAANEGSTITFNASASTDPEGDTLQYRWDFNGDGIWDTTRSADPVASWTFNDDLSTLGKLEVFDGALAGVAEFPVKVYNVAPVMLAGGPPIVAGNLTLNREFPFIDPGADAWEIEISYGDGTRDNVPSSSRTFLVEHRYPAPGDYAVEIRVRDDDGGLGTAAFTVQAGANSPPTPADDLIEITSAVAGNEIRLSVAKLLNNDTDPESDPLSLKEFAAQSANLQSIRREGGSLFYSVPRAPAPTDSFTYTVMDSGGAEGTATVQIVFTENVDPPRNLISVTRLPNGTVRLIFAGIPSRSYVVQASTSLTSLNWISLGTVAAAANGFVTFDDEDAPNHATRFYRTISAK